MTGPDLSVALEAIAPSHLGAKIHLHLAGYRPKGLGNKRPKHRSCEITPMCGAFASSTNHRIPLKVALRWPDRLPNADDPRPQRYWCPACLGHAAYVIGMTPDLVQRIVKELDQ